MSRRLCEAGYKPVFGFLLLAIAFGVLCCVVYAKIKFAPFLMVASALILGSKLSSKSRNDLLKLSFGDSEFRKVRFIENTLISIPFVIVLLISQDFVLAFITLVINGIQSIKTQTSVIQFTLPTPFGKKPFEFPAGFRRSIVPFILIILLTIYGYVIGNFNLIVFSMLLIFMLAISFHLRAEDPFFVWIHKFTPSFFLLRKIATAWFFTSILVVPFVLALLFIYPKEVDVILIFAGIGFVYLATAILAKYASYPNEFSFENTIMIGASIFFPPLLLVLIPIFFVTAKNRLTPFLT